MKQVCEKIVKYCEVCGNEFKVHPYRKDTAKFCSRRCHAIFKFTKPDIRVCKLCGKQFVTSPCYPYIYCSKGCYYQARTNGFYKSVKICLNCGKEFTLNARIKKRKFCTEKCYHEWTKGKNSWNKDKKNCHSEETLEKIRIARKNQRFPTSKTIPELIFIEICKKYRYPFKYTGDGVFWIGNLNPDFIESNGRKLAVEVFGDYWHSPLLRPNLLYDQTHEGRKKRFEKLGWKVIIFWESELKSNIADNIVMDRIRKVCPTLKIGIKNGNLLEK